MNSAYQLISAVYIFGNVKKDSSSGKIKKKRKKEESEESTRKKERKEELFEMLVRQTLVIVKDIGYVLTEAKHCGTSVLSEPRHVTVMSFFRERLTGQLDCDDCDSQLCISVLFNFWDILRVNCHH